MHRTAFTKADLRSIVGWLTRLLPPGQPPRLPEDVVELNELIEKSATMLREQAVTLERGELVFSWRIPREQAPRMNEYAFMKGWQKTRLRKELDDQVRALAESFPKMFSHNGRRRWVRVTRFSTKRVDDVSVDVIGGKMPLDSLVRCGVLAEDNEKAIHRDPVVEMTKPGNTHVFIEVFEMRVEGETTAGTKDAKVTQVTRAEGLMTRAIKGT